jgi:hypothetical protein
MIYVFVDLRIYAEYSSFYSYKSGWVILSKLYLVLKYISIIAIIIGFIKIIQYEKKVMIKIFLNIFSILFIAIAISVAVYFIQIYNIPSARYAKVAPMITYMEIQKYPPMVFTIALIILIYIKKNMLTPTIYTKDNHGASLMYTKKESDNKVIYTISNIEDDSFLKLQNKLLYFYKKLGLEEKENTDKKYLLQYGLKSIEMIKAEDTIIINFVNLEEKNIIKNIW